MAEESEKCGSSQTSQLVISGMSGKLPNCNSVQEFVKKICNKEYLCDADSRRQTFDHPGLPKVLGKVYDVEMFDNGYFGMHSTHCEKTCPMSRMLLEQVVSAILDAGLHPDDLSGSRTGVFIGTCSSDYERLLYNQTWRSADPLIGASKSFIAQRISYALQLNGPAMIIDSACSSSIFALESAYRSILDGRCERAIVGGTSLCLDPFITLNYAKLGILNGGDGCRPFDNDANGYTRSEAIVAIILQKRSEAKRIYANVIHVKTNNDGYKTQGISFPSVDGQFALLEDIYKESNIHPRHVEFVEAHATGTHAGDPEEVAAIDNFFQPTVVQPLHIGSVKANIGHAEASSAICSIIKIVSAFNNGSIPPNIHYDSPRKTVSALVTGRLKVITEPMKLSEHSCIAGVSAFGYGGANGHVILSRQEKESMQVTSASWKLSRLICYSGRDRKAIDLMHRHVQKAKNVEFLGLLQESFKVPLENHLYRGFSLVGTNLHSSKLISYTRQELIITFGNFNNFDNLQNLLQIPLLQKTYQEIKKQLSDCHLNIAICAILIKAFLDLSLQFHVFSDAFSEQFLNGFSNIFTKCFNGFQGFKNLRRKINSRDTILFLGDNENMQTKCNVLHFGTDLTSDKFLFNIGKLFETGFNPRICKLYDPIVYPVSTGTEMISHCIDWKRRSFKLPHFGKSSFPGIEQNLTLKFLEQPELAFYSGHCIGNRNLFPAAGYIWLIWNLYATWKRTLPNALNVVFQNIRFHQAFYITSRPVHLHLAIQPDGCFEISENNATIVTGHISDLKDTELLCWEQFPQDVIPNNGNKIPRTSKDIYKELQLRGYNYKGSFRGLQEVKPNSFTIKWENWVTFLDCMVQLHILHEHRRNLRISIGIEYLAIRAKDHMDLVVKQAEKLLEVQYSESSKVIRSRYVELRHLNYTSILKRTTGSTPVLEFQKFIPNEFETNYSTSIRINMHLLLECKDTLNWQILEMIGMQNEQILSREINVAINDLPLILPHLSIFTKLHNFEMENFKVVHDISQRYLLFVCKDPDANCWEITEKALGDDAFLICLCSRSYNFSPPANYILLTKHLLTDKDGVIFFLRKRLFTAKKPKIVDVSPKELSWLNQLQLLNNDDDIVLFANNAKDCGIVGFANCLRKERLGSKVQCVVNEDVNRNFIENEQFVQQLDKRMPINIFSEGKWGTYRHVSLPKSHEKQRFHWFAKTKKPGDLSSLHWFEGPFTLNNYHTSKPTKIMFAALNPRDLRLATGTLIPDALNKGYCQPNELLGIEFSGIDYQGRKVIGLGSGAISNYIEKPSLVLEIPQTWEMHDAASVLSVYANILLAFSKVRNLHRGQSILIHSGTQDISLGALHFCIYHQFEIFVTIDSNEKRDFLLRHYPNLKASHIINPREFGLKDMISQKTFGRGVDYILNMAHEEESHLIIHCLAIGGHYLHIRSHDLPNNNELSIELAKKQCSYHSIALDYFLFEHSQSDMKKLSLMLSDAIQKGFMKPLPTKIFAIDELEEAFRCMSAGNHIGKLLINIHDKVNKNVLPCLYFNPNCSYVIFGGLGGFGLELADWLIRKGARNLVLSSRKGITTGYQETRISIWKSYGINVEICTEDVTSFENCFKVMNNIHSLCPIDGIFNLAVDLHDATFENQTEESMKAAMLPKAILTSHLDRITRELCPKLNHFVVFSSKSSGLGNVGQTNYAYSNSAMERICERRFREGYRGTAIQWGAIAEVGLLEDITREQTEVEIVGTVPQEIGSCLSDLDELLTHYDKPVVCSMLVAKMRPSTSEESPTQAVQLILAIPDINSVSPHSTFPELGMDSMMLIEIRKTLESKFDIKLSPSELRALTFAALSKLT